MTPAEIVAKSRDKNRPTAKLYIENLVEDFIELKGDRKYADDKSIVAGIGTIHGAPATIISIEKGVDTKDKIVRNFGSASPEGYRKALRLMEQAEKFNRPIICIVDTSGAACGIGAEERGQGEAIADNIMKMSGIKTPILSIIIGEGGSGGALGLAVADEVWITETSTYSVISPEGCASILWKDGSRVGEAADALKMTAPDLMKIKAVDKMILEQDFSEDFYTSLKKDIVRFVKKKMALDKDQLIDERYARFRKF